MKDGLPPLKTLLPFIAAAKHLSFSKAAKELFVTHSAISQSIKQLENFLGDILFIRGPKYMKLTRIGENYAKEINKALLIIEQSSSKICQESNQKVSINAITTFNLHWLIPKLGKLQQQYPEIDCRVANISRTVGFRQDQADISIIYGEQKLGSNYVHQLLYTDELWLVGPNIIDAKKIKSISDIEKLFEKYRCIYVDDNLREQDWAHWCKANHCIEPNPNRRLLLQSSSQALQAVSSGLGLFVTHKPFVLDPIKQGFFQQISKKTCLLPDCFFMVSSKDKLRRSSVAKVFNWISQQVNS